MENPLEKDALNDANVLKAKVMILAIDDVETSTILTKGVRDLNRNCLLIVRSFPAIFLLYLISIFLKG